LAEKTPWNCIIYKVVPAVNQYKPFKVQRRSTCYMHSLKDFQRKCRQNQWDLSFGVLLKNKFLDWTQLREFRGKNISLLSDKKVRKICRYMVSIKGTGTKVYEWIKVLCFERSWLGERSADIHNLFKKLISILLN
jgi:hypothetical protein